MLHDCDHRHRLRGHGRKSTSPNPGDQIDVDTSLRRALAILDAELKKLEAAEEEKTDADVQRRRRPGEIEWCIPEILCGTWYHVYFASRHLPVQ